MYVYAYVLRIRARARTCGAPLDVALEPVEAEVDQRAHLLRPTPAGALAIIAIISITAIIAIIAIVTIIATIAIIAISAPDSRHDRSAPRERVRGPRRPDLLTRRY